jgi:hypothetical protein
VELRVKQAGGVETSGTGQCRIDSIRWRISLCQCTARCCGRRPAARRIDRDADVGDAFASLHLLAVDEIREVALALWHRQHGSTAADHLVSWIVGERALPLD